ncbi:proline--tRNA ligase [Malassezia vespertilionis]|uniref:proline--tRNA ligase n=1 Tax=Malassezia vespertilionis TaxID=2020962 RepID=A0A2N1JD49_9BASI|nr:proline--tRNA ligase [Malassezia vespertilionis]PKI84464.1 hypothetical protein MVES_001719 [Malassezia vespertilionis]WFD06472.1 proline--tRNA ligase [Malassezia vespertilionis]
MWICARRRIKVHSATARRVHTAWPKAARPVRLSALYSPTLSADATSAADSIESLKLLLRGGYVRQTASGSYTYLPLGMRMIDKIRGIIDEEMQAIGASCIEMPQLLGSALWHKTGRMDAMGSELFRLRDRRGAEMILAPTHEEEVTRLIGSEIDSAKCLPVRVYQIGRKFRDEPRPRAGLLRTKEFLMKDLYTFDSDADAAKASYADVGRAYSNIFNRVFDWQHLGESATVWRAAEADTGAMGGTFSHEYHVEDPIGEDTVLSCSACAYSANTECATSKAQPAQHFQVQLHQRADASSLYALVMPKSAVLHPLAMARFGLVSWNGEGRADKLRVLVDSSCALPDTTLRTIVQDGIANRVTDVPAISTIQQDTQLCAAQAGDPCSECPDGALEAHRAIEVGHTFLLGTRYSTALGYGVGSGAQRVPLQMGCYGIGVTRVLGALAQHAARMYTKQNTNAQRKRAGFVWPLAVAPFRALVLPSPPHTPEKMHAANTLCALLDNGTAPRWCTSSGPLHLHVPHYDIALDDRSCLSFGARIFDADLVGYPLVFILGKHWEKTGEVEVRMAGGTTRYAHIEGVSP